MLFRDGDPVPASLERRLTVDDTLWARALRLHFDALVFDGHIDTPTAMLDGGYRLGDRHNAQPGSAHVDLPRMAEGGLDAAFFSLFVSRHFGEGEKATARALELLGELEQQVSVSEGAEIVRTAGDVRRVTRAGKNSCASWP